MEDVSRRRVKLTVSGRTDSSPVGSLTWRAWLNLAGMEGCGFSSRWEGGSGDVSIDNSFRGLDEWEGRKESAGWKGVEGNQLGKTQLLIAAWQEPAQRRCEEGVG